MKAGAESSVSASIREGLDHPVIDADLHSVEFMPALLERLGDEAGGDMVLRLASVFDAEDAFPQSNAWYTLSKWERQRRRLTRPGFWGFPTRNTRDRATCHLPALLYERMQEFGFDYGIAYPTLGLVLPHLEDEALRRAALRALNRHNAEVFKPLADRLTHAAVIPMHSPEEAVDELRYVVGTLGMKTILMPSFIHRPVAVSSGGRPREPYWFDTYAIDSEHDYDVVWQTCRELRVAPAFHSSLFGLGVNRSVSSYIYNHVGMFAAAHLPIAKALVLGGVTRRFPDLRFAFLEGGVAWALDALGLLAGHFDRRNRRDIENYNPKHLDFELFRELFQRFGGSFAKYVDHERALAGMGLLDRFPEDPGAIDEFAATGAERPEDFIALFADPFFFGCEAEEPMLPAAFRGPSPLGARLKVLMGSDIGHWDVAEMNEVLAEAYEAVERGALNADEFADFVFRNPVRLHGQPNPRFFEGTAVEQAAKRVLDGPGHQRRG